MRLHKADILCSHSLVPGHDIERDSHARLQSPEAISLNGGKMNEQILSTIPPDEPKAPRSAEPHDNASCHTTPPVQT